MSVARTATLPQGNPISRIPFIYEVETKKLENPDEIERVRVRLPSGLTARFVRVNTWVILPYAPLT